MKFSASEKRMLAFCVVAIALPLGVGLFLNRINATPKINIPAPVTPPAPNGHDLYVAASKAIIPANPAVDYVTDIDTSGGPDSTKAAEDFFSNAKRRAARYSLARKNAWLATNKPAFALFDRAQKTPSLAPPVRSSATMLPHLSQLRALARNKTVESNARLMRGDHNGALQSGLDIVQMGHDIRRGGILITSMVGSTIGRTGRASTVGTIEHLNAKQARDAARHLENLLETRWTLAQTLTEEKYSTQSNLMELFGQPKWRSVDFSTDLSPTGSHKWAQTQRIRLISKQQIMDDITALFDVQISNSPLPYARRHSISEPDISDDPYSGIFGINFDPARFTEAGDLAGDQCLMLRLALRAYRLENGAYPPILNTLAPDYLASIPADPFGSGESWRYKTVGQNYLLWSVGPDEQDNGGAPITWKNGPPKTFPDQRPRLPFIMPDSTGDYVAGTNG